MKILLPFFVVFVVSACRDEAITRVRAAKDDAPAAATPEAPAAAQALTWTLPRGWKELPGSGMRLATILPPGPGKAEATVIALPGDVGGKLANVNRWRGQIGLPALDKAGLAEERAKTASRAGPVTVYDFTSQDAKTRLVAGTLSSGGRMWFFKLMGDAGPVAAARPGFMSLLGSLHASR